MFLCALAIHWPVPAHAQSNTSPETAVTTWVASWPESFRQQYGEVKPIAFFTNDTSAVAVISREELDGSTGLFGQCFVKEGAQWKTHPRALPNFLRKGCGLTDEQIQSLAEPIAQFNTFMKYRRHPGGITVVPGTGSPAGSWHNGKDGFYTTTLSFRSDGEGVLGAAIAGIPFRWQTNDVGMVLVLDDGTTTTNIPARFEVEKDVIVLLRKEKEEPFWRVSTNEPPTLEELRKGVSPTR